MVLFFFCNSSFAVMPSSPINSGGHRHKSSGGEIKKTKKESVPVIAELVYIINAEQTKHSPSGYLLVCYELNNPKSVVTPCWMRGKETGVRTLKELWKIEFPDARRMEIVSMKYEDNAYYFYLKPQ